MIRPSKAQLFVGTLLVLCAGCGDSGVDQPASLQTPRALTLAQGPVCLTSDAPFGGAVHPVLRQWCEDDQGGQRPGTLGLVANQAGDSVGVVDLSRDMRGSPPQNPRMVDLDPATPGVNHIKVGRSPVDVAAGGGTTAYALNQADQTVSVINLTVLKALEEPIFFDGTLQKLVVTPPSSADDTDDEDDSNEWDTGTLAVAFGHPDADDASDDAPASLWLHDELDCAFPEGDADGFIDRDAEPADTGCDAVPSLQDGQTVELAGDVNDIVADPDGQRLYVIYSDAPFVSVIALDDQALEEFDDGCLDGDQAPCEAARVGLTYECSNGVDDDGDGDVDQEDAQCYGARGAESPEGIGRNPVGACANGEDDDEDGLIDREDPDCLISGAASEEEPVVEDPQLACMDERDNDADGATDYPDDDACYGEVGRTEQAPPAGGFAAASVDRFGNFLYVVDRAQNQVLVVDAGRLELIDAFDAGGRDRTAFSNRLGIAIPPSPTAIEARVDREVVWCETEACTRGVVRYLHGAYVATDGGAAYDLSAMTTYCEVSGAQDLQAGLDPAAESDCLQVPEFPIAYDADACQEGEEPGEDCLNERTDDAITFNPNFELRDAEPTDSRLRGLGTCETPDEFISELRGAASGAADVSCTSPLRPQPVAPGDVDGFDGNDFDRAELLTESTVALEADGQSVDPSVMLEVADQEIIEETWAVTWEGVLPDTNRDDGVVSEEPGEFQVGSLDLCEAGVEEGDRLTILSAPSDADGCEVFADDPEAAATSRTWAIDEVRADELVLSVIGDEGEGEDFADELPSRACFETGVRFEIRADDEWIVVGGQTGFLSERTSVLGTCQPRHGADHPRYDSRVDTGERFDGPYLSFVMREGMTADGEVVEPRRDGEEELTYRFSLQRNFQPAAFTTTAALPTRVLLADQVPGARFLLIPDPASNFIYVRNLQLSGDQADFLLQ